MSRHGEEEAMLKAIKRIQQSTQLKVMQKGTGQSTYHAETKISNLFNIDPYPEPEKPLKIDLHLYQLEDYE